MLIKTVYKLASIKQADYTAGMLVEEKYFIRNMGLEDGAEGVEDEGADDEDEDDEEDEEDDEEDGVGDNLES